VDPCKLDLCELDLWCWADAPSIMSARPGLAHIITHGPMFKHPVSAAFRLLPALCWLIAAAVCTWMSARLSLLLLTPDKWDVPDRPWPELVFVCGFVGVAIYSVRMAYKEYKEALPAIRADVPLWPPTPRRPDVDTVPKRFPLPEAQRIQLQTVHATLVATSVLHPADVQLEELIESTETMDDFSAADCSEAFIVFNVLWTLRATQRHFQNLAFVKEHLEEHDVLAIVHDFARLAGRTDQLQSVRLQGMGGGPVVPARRGEFPTDNAVIEVELAERRIGLTFVMYGDNFPIGLMEKLPRIFAQPSDPRRFFSAYFDSFVVVTYLSTDQAATLNLAFSHQPDCFELLEQRA